MRAGLPCARQTLCPLLCNPISRSRHQDKYTRTEAGSGSGMLRARRSINTDWTPAAFLRATPRLLFLLCYRAQRAPGRDKRAAALVL